MQRFIGESGHRKRHPFATGMGPPTCKIQLFIANLGEHLASGSRFLFWGIVPVGTLLIVLLNISVEWNFKRRILVGLIDLTFILLALGLYNSKKFSWALRLMMLIIYGAYCAFVVDSIFFSPHRGWSEPINALHGLVVIGIPALLYATRGFASHKKQANESNPYGPDPIEPE